MTFSDIRVVNPSFQVDPNITDERGYTADVGIRGRTDRLNLDVSLFLLHYGNRLGEVLQPEIRIDAEGNPQETGRIVRLRTNVGSARLIGWESLVDWRVWQSDPDGAHPTRIHLYGNLALIGSTYLSSRLNGVTGNQVEFVPALNLRTGIRAYWGAIKGSLQWSTLSGQYTDATNAPRNPLDNQSGIIGSIPAYDVMDLSLAWSWRWLQLEGGINNLLNRHYFTRRATGYPGPGIIPSAPRTGYLTVGVIW